MFCCIYQYIITSVQKLKVKKEEGVFRKLSSNLSQTVPEKSGCIMDFDIRMCPLTV